MMFWQTIAPETDGLKFFEMRSDGPLSKQPPRKSEASTLSLQQSLLAMVCLSRIPKLGMLAWGLRVITENAMANGQPARLAQVQRAIRLEYFTVFYNLLEGMVSLVLGGLASSVALIGFGLDSFVESFSGLVVLWRFRGEARGPIDGTRLESRAILYVGWSFFLLSGYILFESTQKLWLQLKPDPSPLGILLAVVSLIVMPVLARRKYRVGKVLRSQSMVGDSKQTLACSFLSLALLLGLTMNARLGWWWADPLAALLMVPWLIKEGKEALKGESCCASRREV